MKKNQNLQTADSRPGERKQYASLTWPALRIWFGTGKEKISIQFENGFYSTADAKLQKHIESSDAYTAGHVRDVTDLVRKLKTMGERGKLYLSWEEPELSIQMRARFYDGVLSTRNPDIQRLVENHPLFKTKKIRAIPHALLMDAPEAKKAVG